jgi:TRAP-type C4-dicarboxylate transport system substrate-binding protein
MKLSSLIKPLTLAALLTAAGAQAQTVLRIGYAVPTNSHYGVGATVLCELVGTA